MKKDWNIFISSVFFVLGFVLVFTALGILLQGVLYSISGDVRLWITRVGGIIIVLFGILLLDFIKIPYLMRDHKLQVKRKFKSMHLTSFVFGAAFAAGWTPCVGPVLGAVLTLAVSNPSSAFFLMLAYSLGMGLPFLLVGLFTNEAQRFIKKSGKYLHWFKYIFGVILIIIGFLILTNNLGLISNHSLSMLMTDLNGSVSYGSSLNIGIAFLAGIVSFLSPCVLPLIPAFLAYLASVGVNGAKKD